MTATTPDALNRALCAQFAGRPTMAAVSRELLCSELRQLLPGLAEPFDDLSVALPLAEGRPGWNSQPLLKFAQGCIAQYWVPDLSPRQGLSAYLTRQLPHPESNGGKAIDMNEVRAMLAGLADDLPGACQQALLSFWQGKSDAGVTRIAWLSQALRQAFCLGRDQAGGYVDLANALIVGDATTLKTWCVQACLTVDGQALYSLLPDLLLQQGERWLWCSPNAPWLGYSSQQGLLGALHDSLQMRYRPQHITYTWFETSQDPFAVQAELLLNQQLDAIQALDMRAAGTFALLERQFAELSEIRLGGHESPDDYGLASALPGWMSALAPTDRFRLRRHLLDLAVVQQRANGKGFLDGLPSLREYCNQALNSAMQQDHPQAQAYDPEGVILEFAVPYGQGGFGFVEKVRMPLSELALRNLQALPGGDVVISHADGSGVPTWLTLDYLGKLVQRVDVGQHYPELLQRELLADLPAVKARRQLFREQLAVQLPILALQQKIEGQGALSEQGYTLVANLMAADIKGGRRYGARLRALTFLSGPGASGDVAANMFVFSGAQVNKGPLVLYRPGLEGALREFANAQAFFAALQSDAGLAQSILAALPAPARPLYDNGGFAQAHVPVLVDDPFAIVPPGNVPTLGGAVFPSDVLTRLYTCNAEFLLAQAREHSVSNQQSRIDLGLRLGGLLFSTFLPFLTGPAAVAGWLLQLIGSIKGDVEQLRQGDPQQKAAALVDLLFNLVTVITHGPTATDADSHGPGVELAMPLLDQQSPVSRWLAIPIAPEKPGTKPARLQQAHSRLDLSWAGLGSGETRELLAFLERVALPVPAVLPAPVPGGLGRGLFSIDGHLHALIQGRLFRVLLVRGTFHIIDPADPADEGVGRPMITWSGDKQWQLDLRLRLRGGAPERAVRMTRQRAEVQFKAKLRELDQASDAIGQARARVLPLEDKVSDQMDIVHECHDAFEQDRSAASLARALQARETARGLVADLSPVRAEYAQALHAFIDLSADGTRALTVAERFDLLKWTDELAIDFYYDQAECLLLLQKLATDERQEALLNGHWFKSWYGVRDDRAPSDELEYMALVMHIEALSARALQHLSALDGLLLQVEKLPAYPSALIKGKVQGTRRRLDTMTTIQARVDAMRVQSELSLDLRIPTMDERLYYEEFLGGSDLFASAFSHAQLGVAPEEITAEEKMKVLQGALQSYAKAREAAEFVRASFPVGEQHDYLADYVAGIATLQMNAQTELAGIIRTLNDDFNQPQPASPAVRERKRKVFKTRTRNALVGVAREPSAAEPFLIYDVLDPVSHTVVASYREHQDEQLFVEIVTAKKPPPMPAAGKTALKALRKQAHGQLERSEQEQLSAGLAPLDRWDPWEIEFPLLALARDIEGTVAKLDQHAPLAEPYVGVRARLSAAVQALKATGTRVRVAMCKAQLPTGENLQYLYRQGAVAIARIGKRTSASRTHGGFFDEYSIRDKQGELLWYAHLHYATEQAPRGEFSVAHLKLPAQRRLGLEAQLKQARNDQQVIRIWRGHITDRQVLGWFPLA
ncbi:dermonecrotic toxin domain-containing protein [Pseudomonas abieticivorans]|uniref:dermonecrotic toxin domain-containing protein n=1 Tax=Pseudomonas abieticivorans TaxID=2931382 RepID=UPI0020BFC193|nr:DUF6543 domain-containing protein [Pseudomonas sp. PIA16]